MLGQTLGHYRLSAEIGAGAMGKVYRATDLRLNRDVAVKVLPPDLLADADARRRFRKEALTLSSADHPNIAVIFDFDTDAGTDFLVMELIPGESLSELLGRGPLPATEVARLGIQLADALDAAHRRNIIHRDIKPGNLRRTPDGRLKVLDFGIARRVASSDDPTQTDSSMTTHAPGTLPYMAPEQLRGQVADPRSDIYAAGVVLYEMATGRRLFTGRNAAEVIHAIVNEPVVSPRAIAPDIPEPVESVILKAIDKHADRRYQSAREMAIDLRRIVEPSVVARTPRRSNARSLSRSS